MDLASLRADGERALRRGDLREALTCFAQLAKALPDDPAIRERFATIRALVQQGELGPPKAPGATPAPPAAPGAVGEAEAALRQGDLRQALLLYRQALAESPGNALLLERAGEILAALKAQRATAPTATAPSTPPAAAAAAAPAARYPTATATRPTPPTPTRLPTHQEFLELLLARVLAAGRRA